MEQRLFDPENPPYWLEPAWWRNRMHCDHLGAETGAHTGRLKYAAALAIAQAGRFGGPSVDDLGTIVDLGAGDGALLSLLPPEIHEQNRAWGYDIIEHDITYAKTVRDVDVRPANVREALEAGELELGEVVVLTEVLEHMADPHGFLDLLAHEAQVRYVVASSPYGETAERHEWNHAWCWDEQGYQAMFTAAGFDTVVFARVEWSQLWAFEAPVAT